jgi:hypothetical protein
MGAPLHAGVSVAGARLDPIWIYDLERGRWRMGPLTGGTTPRLFAGAAAVDPATGSIWYLGSIPGDRRHLPIGGEYRFGRGVLWRLDADLGTIERVDQTSTRPALASLSAEFDPVANRLIFFSGGPAGSRIRSYTPTSAIDSHPGAIDGRWRNHGTNGTACGQRARYPSYPTATDSRRHQYVTLPTNADGIAGRTCLYDPKHETTTHLKDSSAPDLGMNFNLHYVPSQDRFILIHGDSLHHDRAQVHSLRLRQPNAAPPQATRQ